MLQTIHVEDQVTKHVAAFTRRAQRICTPEQGLSKNANNMQGAWNSQFVLASWNSLSIVSAVIEWWPKVMPVPRNICYSQGIKMSCQNYPQLVAACNPEHVNQHWPANHVQTQHRIYIIRNPNGQSSIRKKTKSVFIQYMLHKPAQKIWLAMLVLLVPYLHKPPYMPAHHSGKACQ
jgi:hypothetical protein